MNKTIAIPLENGILCAHFGHCEKFAIVKVEDCKIVDVKEITPPEHVPGLYPSWVAQFGTTDVIAGGMGQKPFNFSISRISMCLLVRLCSVPGSWLAISLLISWS